MIGFEEQRMYLVLAHRCADTVWSDFQEVLLFGRKIWGV